MQQIINFVLRNKNFLLYLFLLFISLLFVIQSHSYHKSKFAGSANAVSGSVYNLSHSVTQYFNLKKQNSILLEENKYLKSILYNSNSGNTQNTTTLKDTVSFSVNTAEVIKNSYKLFNNYLTINKGKDDNVQEGLGVISSKGIVGIVNNTSNHFSRVLSVLNTKSQINAKLKKTNHFGILTWNGKSPYTVQLIDIPNQAPLKIGDTVVTGGYSTIFPKNIPIGKVSSFSLDETKNYYLVNVDLFNNLTNLNEVYVIKNLRANEINALNTTNEQ